MALSHNAAFNTLSNQENVPECLSALGLSDPAFYRALCSGPGYLALYELESADALKTDDYLRMILNTIHTQRDPHSLETRPESQLVGFSTAPERRNTVVHDVFVHATRFNHP